MFSTLLLMNAIPKCMFNLQSNSYGHTLGAMKVKPTYYQSQKLLKHEQREAIETDKRIRIFNYVRFYISQKHESKRNDRCIHHQRWVLGQWRCKIHKKVKTQSLSCQFQKVSLILLASNQSSHTAAQDWSREDSVKPMGGIILWLK